MLWITLVNVSDGEELSDYEYTVGVNRRVIESGYVRGHQRTKGWEALVRRWLETREVTNE